MGAAHYCPKCLTSFTSDPPTCPNLGCRHDRPPAGWGHVLGTGDLLDRHYRITQVLAVGGMGITYQARAVDGAGQFTGPEVAIKVLFPGRDSGPFLRRLANEAQILQELAHSHIVECRGFVQRTGDAPYLVTRFEGGGTLGAHVQRVGPLTPPVAAAVLDQVLEALEVAHGKGIVHRDLKPDNVLLATGTLASDVPWVRVADFGIAKVFDSPGFTRLGTFLGTPEYAAPEQFEGLAPTPATDVWAAGALLYHLLVGRPPVEFTHRADIESDFTELLKQVPPKLPDAVAAEGRALLQSVLDHTMTPEPGDRWPVRQLREHIAALPPAQRPSAPRRPDDGLTALPTLAPPTVWVADPAEPAPAEPAAPTAEPAVSAVAAPAPAAATAPAPAEPPRAAVGPRNAPAPPPHWEEPPTGPGVGAGVLGLGAIVFVGSALSGMVLAIAAWGFGWFGPAVPAEIGAPVPLDPVHVVAATPKDPDPAEKTALEAALKVAAADLALLCKPTGSIPIRVVVEPDGTVRSAAVDPRVLSHQGAACVEKAVSHMDLPRTGTAPVALSVTLTFGR